MSQYQYTLVGSIETENRPEISILMPSIRVHQLDVVYNTIIASTKRSFEVIVVGPYPLTEFLQDKKNIKYVKDYGSPVRAAQIAASIAEGKVITWGADDAWYLEDSLDNNLNSFFSMPYDVKNVGIARYYEGENRSGKDVRHGSPDDSYYKLTKAYPATPFIHPDWWIFNTTLIYREFFEDVGGFDCVYQSFATSNADLAVRCQALGAKVSMSDFPMINCDCTDPGDHAPIVQSQFQEDYPVYIDKYSRPLVEGNLKIRMDNWKKAPAVWKKRF